MTPARACPTCRRANTLVWLGVGIALAAAACAPSAASTASAWSDLERKMSFACTKASGLLDARPSGKPVHFDDRNGMSALLVRGRFPQPHMQQRPTVVLCLFDRRSQRVSIADAEPMFD